MTWDGEKGVRNRGVVVTGAARGIGRSVALMFASAGANVLAVDINDAVMSSTLPELKEQGEGPHHALVADLRDLTGHAAIFQQALDSLGRFDHLVHVAAVLRRRTDIDDVTEDDWDFQVDVNLKATFFLMREGAKALRLAGDGGSLTAFTSQGWMTGGFGGSVAYAATKGGIVSMTRGMARTWAPDGIRVNTVSPGAVDTPMMLDGMTDEAMDSFVSGIPMGRLADPDELATSVVFLASDNAAYITGATLNVSGGFLMY